VRGDAYAGEWPREQFRKHGVAYELSEKNRSELYLDLIPVVNSKRCELPDNRKLIDELRRLERRRGKTGKDSVDHPGQLSDDLANATAGAISMAQTAHVDVAGIVMVGQRLSRQAWDEDEPRGSIAEAFDSGRLFSKKFPW
jgi:hypothetical protein